MTDRPRHLRSTCCVLGCTHWSEVFPGEWMCADHWRSVPALLRKLLRRRWRRHAASWAMYEEQKTKRSWQSEHRAWRASERLWRRARRIATEKAAGL